MKNKDLMMFKVAGVVAVIAFIVLMLIYPSVQVESLNEVMKVSEDGYIAIDGYSDVRAEGARVFTTRTGFAIAPVTRETEVIAIKNGRFRVKVACGVLKPGQVTPDVTNDDFIDGLVTLTRQSFSPEYHKYFPMISKVYRDALAKNYSTSEELRQDIVIGTRKVLGFDEPEKDSVMESQFQEFFGPNGTLAKYIYSKYPEDVNWSLLIPQIATAFERI